MINKSKSKKGITWHRLNRMIWPGLWLGGLGWWLLFPGLALAHESREVAAGKYQMRVGFLTEPAYQGLENGLELTICTGSCTSNTDNSGTYTNGVTGAFDSLKVEVIFGARSMPLTLTAVPRNPGRYSARFMPTREGTYSFHITGTLGPEKAKIDERFISSPSTFDDVQPLAVAQFPDKPGFQLPGQALAQITNASGATLAAPVSTSASVPTSATQPGSSSTNTASVTSGSAAPVAPPSSTASAITGSTNSNGAGSNLSELQEIRRLLGEQQQLLNDSRVRVEGANLTATFGITTGLAGLLIGLAALWLVRRRSKSSFNTPQPPKRPRREPEGG